MAILGVIALGEQMKTERLQVMIDQRLAEMITDYRFENRIESRSEAARLLIESGLKNEKAEAAVSAATPA